MKREWVKQRLKENNDTYLSDRLLIALTIYMTDLICSDRLGYWSMMACMEGIFLRRGE